MIRKFICIKEYPGVKKTTIAEQIEGTTNFLVYEGHTLGLKEIYDAEGYWAEIVPSKRRLVMDQIGKIVFKVTGESKTKDLSINLIDLDHMFNYSTFITNRVFNKQAFLHGIFAPTKVGFGKKLLPSRLSDIIKAEADKFIADYVAWGAEISFNLKEIYAEDPEAGKAIITKYYGKTGIVGWPA